MKSDVTLWIGRYQFRSMLEVSADWLLLVQFRDDQIFQFGYCFMSIDDGSNLSRIVVNGI